ncbi:hypothetical protein C7999DRAFT_44988 [Corynascus novoguineensis]|uniref:Uncharacterized protein n=1 Tax=Corynascus novoguineensis TaxID=1126955 RepID=A0AAN7CL92_9PEZI|nr:hypothetical protein C7999DRAFT_44988 [Corynascus novoguineensis]
MEQGVRTQRSPEKAGHHHPDPKPETGYTDEAAVEVHDLIDNAEENAHLHDPNSMYATTDKPEPVHRAMDTAKSASQKVQETGKNVTQTVGQKMDQMKKGMGLEK